jgi:hypothetical protein
LAHDVKIQNPLRSTVARQAAKCALLLMVVIAWFIGVTSSLARITHYTPPGPARSLNESLALFFASHATTGILGMLSRLGSVLATLALAAPLGVFFLSTAIAQRLHRRSLD